MRVLAWLIILSPIIALVVLIAWPAAVIEQERTRALDVETEIDLLEQQVSQREHLLSELRLLERARRADTQLIVGETPALAGATLQGVVSDLLAGAGAELETTQVLPVEISEPFTEVSIRAGFRSSIDSLREALHAFEGNEPALIIRDISVTQDRGIDSTSAGPVLDVRIDLLSYGRFESSSEEPAQQ